MAKPSDRQLQQALEVVRSYDQTDQAQVDQWIDAAAAGEAAGLDPMRDIARTT
ncbi:hypothetical protein [Nocardioides sp. URHA0020]|uniref:hypothetical protein n=1 Tax=Nocardioides sp. URHA0020 TaxID=1380392 RepID=UPI0012DE114D|nr:hypothetical protein [Nocardioides sp. URHA0020]